MRCLQAAVVGVAVASFGCTPDWARENETGLMMEVQDIVTFAGGESSGTEGEILNSDVNPVFNDDAVVTVQLFRKNPTVGGSTPLEDVRLDAYQVRYFRTDGHSVEGVDVPYRITGALNTTILHAPDAVNESTAEIAITLVRHQAKLEPPLINLVGISIGTTGSPILRGAGIITTVAEITVYGRQVSTGHALSAIGRVQVTFADFADEQ